MVINYFSALSEDPNEWLTTNLELPDQAFALEIKGDSMLPDFKAGDRVIIDPSVIPSPGDFVVSSNPNHEATFKKYRPRGLNDKGEAIIELVPLNPDYPSIRSDTSSITIKNESLSFQHNSVCGRCIFGASCGRIPSMFRLFNNRSGCYRNLQ